MLSLFGMMAMLSGCQKAEEEASHSQYTEDAKHLVVITRNDSSTYFIDENGAPGGFEFELVTKYAKSIGKTVKWKLVNQVSEVVPLLKAGKADMAALGISNRFATNANIPLGPIYKRVTPVVVYHRSNLKPIKKIKDLVGHDVKIEYGSGAASDLEALSKNIPNLKWTLSDQDSPEELIEAVANQALDVTIANEVLAKHMKRFYPDLEIGPSLGANEPVTWLFAEHREVLVQSANSFIVGAQKDGSVKRLMDRYYGHLDRLQPADVTKFLQQRVEVLPKLRPFFHEAQKLTGIDWRLLAAVGYQESHWNPLAVSPAGVRGLMMLTEQTAAIMGVKNRTDARQNILGGAKYIRRLVESLPLQIVEPDRNWIALAAYNTGLGHLEDARVLADRQKMNPDAWIDLKGTLVQLRNPKWFTKVKHGYARGGETVIFVENIRTYYDILSKFEQPLVEVFPPKMGIELPASQGGHKSTITPNRLTAPT
ncbi:membrane-bound lytic murein transglycosylase MltF [Leeia sp. TBRC 13508]|uniref:Membrane-bound lytic murein transglycosylase MltF n=1 Tax=Leeia speluncae TaxID=2884804 RepID=A0ABS8D8J5_9NEIS|nr:membrane-bound lytic murein transglycosylase MltF [Leeia speluncae]MCB6184510.1 membrane-bound lytic murein transglycosylase MltF [Leeia speluncae]